METSQEGGIDFTHLHYQGLSASAAIQWDHANMRNVCGQTAPGRVPPFHFSNLLGVLEG